MYALFFVIMVAVSAKETVLLEARYTAVKGSDPEYGQGAIEKCDLRHAVIERFVWVIEVDSPAETAAWERRLNAAVDKNHGRFAVAPATAEEEELVRSGRVQLQR